MRTRFDQLQAGQQDSTDTLVTTTATLAAMSGVSALSMERRMDTPSLLKLDIDPQAYSFGAATASFRDCISMIQTLLQHDILPTLKPRKVKSLRLLGSTESKQGIVYRPEMWRQRETLEMIQQYCQQDGTKTSFSTWPAVPKLAPCIEPRFGELPGDTQEAKQRRYKERRWHIRQSQ